MKAIVFLFCSLPSRSLPIGLSHVYMYADHCRGQWWHTQMVPCVDDSVHLTVAPVACCECSQGVQGFLCYNPWLLWPQGCGESSSKCTEWAWWLWLQFTYAGVGSVKVRVWFMLLSWFGLKNFSGCFLLKGKKRGKMEMKRGE